jgi:hypothetical protein
MNFPLNDGSLPRTSVSPESNRRVILFGTSELGPMHTAMSVIDGKAARSIFGSSSKGTLVRAIDEAIGAQSASKKQANIVAVRLGKELAKKATKQYVESGGSTVALTLHGTTESAKLNEVLTSIDANEFKIYNPIQSKWAVFAIDFTASPNQALYNDVLELADAINSDSVSSEVVLAVPTFKNARFELDLAAGDFSSDYKIDLGDSALTEVTSNLVLDNAAVVTAKGLVGASYLQPADDELKRVQAINSVYAITASDFVEVPANTLQYEIPSGVVHKTANVGYDTLLNVSEVKSVDVDLAEWAKIPNSDVGGTPAVKGSAFELFDDEVFTALAATNATDTVTATVTSEFGLALTGTGLLDAADITTYAYEVETAMGYTPDEMVAADLLPASANTGVNSAFGVDENFVIKLSHLGQDYYFHSADAGAILWTTYVSATKLCTIALDGSKAKNALGIVDALSIADEAAETALVANAVITGTGISATGLMTETPAGNTLGSATSAYRFFGNTLKFGAASSRRRLVRHLSRIDYSLEDVVFSQTDRYIQLNGPAPGLNAGAMSGNIVVGFDIDYIPANPATTVAQSLLTGGAAGYGIVDNPTIFKREVLQGLYATENLEYSAISIPKFYLDAVETTYNPLTGAQVIQNAGYADLISDYLNDQYGGHAEAFLDVMPLVGTGPNSAVTRADVSARFEKMAVVNSVDPLRAANKIAAISDLHLFLVDMEAEFTSDNVTYTAPCAAAMAGLASTMKSDSALYTMKLPNVNKLVWRYTERNAAGESQVDLLSTARVNVGIVESRGVFISDAITLAGEESDYTLLSTFWMVEKMLGIAEVVGKDYMGKSPSLLRIQSLYQALRSAYDEMKPDELTAYDLKINVDSNAKAMKTIDLQLQPVPAGETRGFTMTTTLRNSEADIV